MTAMMITRCEHCGREIDYVSQDEGKVVECPRCKCRTALCGVAATIANTRDANECRKLIQKSINRINAAAGAALMLAAIQLLLIALKLMPMYALANAVLACMLAVGVLRRSRLCAALLLTLLCLNLGTVTLWDSGTGSGTIGALFVLNGLLGMRGTFEYYRQKKILDSIPV